MLHMYFDLLRRIKPNSNPNFWQWEPTSPQLTQFWILRARPIRVHLALLGRIVGWTQVFWTIWDLIQPDFESWWSNLVQLNPKIGSTRSCWPKNWVRLQVNLCQKHLFLHQLTHNMMTDCSLNYEFITWKFQAQNMLRTCWEHVLYINCSECQNKNQFVYTISSQHVLNMFWAWDFHVLNS